MPSIELQIRQPDYFIDDNGLPNILHKNPDRKACILLKSPLSRLTVSKKLLSKRESVYDYVPATHSKAASVAQITPITSPAPCLDKTTKNLLNQRLKHSRTVTST